jgi:hypothetical protein
MIVRPPSLWLVLLACAGCDWVSLARHSLTYRTTARGETANLAAAGGVLYATLAEDGFAIADSRTGAVVANLPPPPGAESVDDLAVAGDFLFALDARPPGFLAVYAIHDVGAPRLVAPARPVPVGPFSGVSARGGVCMVSGGTSQLTLWRYDERGTLRGPIGTADVGRGQPDILIATSGLAIVSAHYWGPYFGVATLGYDTTGALTPLAELHLEGAGFTDGGAKPASFPLQAAALDPRTVVIAYARELAVVDVTDPARPRIAETVQLDGPAVSIATLGTTVLVAVAGREPALILFDVTRGAATRIRTTLPPGTIPGGVALTATRAAVAVGGRPRGILVFPR